MFPKPVSGTSIQTATRKANTMFAEYIIVAAQSCQSGQCPKQTVTTTTTKTVTVVESPKTAPAIFLAPERPKRRLLLPRLFQGPVVFVCEGGACK